MKCLFEYMMMTPLAPDELPEGQIEYEIYKDERGIFGGWGRVVYDKPLTGAQIDHYDLDGPLLYSIGG